MDMEQKIDKRMKKELSAQYELLKVIAEQNHEKILEYDVATDTVSIYNVVNGQFLAETEIANYVRDGHFGESFIFQEDRAAYRRVFQNSLKKAAPAIIDLRCALEGEELEWHRLYLVGVPGKDKKIARIAGRFVSIHKDKMLAEQMRLKAEIDALTGVYNHIAFEEVCGRAIAQCETDAMFLMLDVDDFKMVNDTQGHAVGDMVLSHTGAILNQMVEGRGVAGRLGGDEFAAFAWGFSNLAEMKAFCDELRRELKTIVFDMEYSASIGVSTVGGRDVTFVDLYYEADQAVYGAKNGGKNQYVFFSEMAKITTKADPKVENYQTPSFDEIDEKALLEEYGRCMNYMTKEPDYRSGIERVQRSLLEYFDADCVAVVSWDGEHYFGIEECHKESAEITAKIMIKDVEQRQEASFRELTDAKGYISLNHVKEIKETYPVVYGKLVESRVWALLGFELRMSGISQGVLVTVNPRRHLSERLILRMLAEYLVARMMTQRVMEVREHETTHDRLTGLWNRNSFILWENTWRNETYASLGIVTTDVVGLAHVNRDFGYLMGSRKLVAIARTLQTVFEGYRCFRYDGDEMLVFCPNVAHSDFEFMIRCLKEKLEELDFAVALGYSWSSHANISNQIAEAEAVMRNDKIYHINGNSLVQRAEQSVIDEINTLIREGRYLIYMQPKVNVHTGETVGAEALVRQVDPDLGMVSPGVFIPVLERYNLIHMVDLFVLEQVFRFQRAALDAGRKVVPISTNFSKLTILHPNLLERVKSLSEQYDVPEGLIHIEVTETVGDMDHVVIDRVADNLKTLGFKLSMDDFGTHYSNLAVLIQYDFDSAKIDRSMIMDIATNEKSRIVVDYMASLISELGINCIAEGVETKEQVDIMKETKCEIIQGYYFGKPVPQEEFYDTFIRDEEQ